MASSTRRGALPRGWRLEDIPDDDLASMLAVSRQEVVARRAEMMAAHRNPAWVAAALETVPAASLALLQLLVEAGGLAFDNDLVREAGARFGLTELEVHAAVAPAVASSLVVPLGTRDKRRAFGLVQPAGELVAPLVADLDLGAMSSSELVVADAPARNARTFLAACIAARHFDIKLTMDGYIHRGSIKRLAKQVGVRDDDLDAMLGLGLGLGLLLADGDVVRPDLAALADAAVGRYSSGAGLAVIEAQLADGPVAVAALFASMERRADLRHARLVLHDELAYLPGFAVGLVRGVKAAALRAPEGVASGHVTPSFEVVLPPEARLLDIVQVGACCDWERLDRAIVARITKSAIARAVSAGATAEQIVGWLSAASRHPLPQNVEAAVRDWAGSVIAATIATGHVVVVEPSAAARAGAALAKLGARLLAPGVFLVTDEGARDIAQALTQAGIHQRAPASAPAPPSRARKAELPVVVPGNARLRARVAAWRRGEPFEGVRDEFLDKVKGAPMPPKEPSGPPAPTALLARWAAEQGMVFADGDADRGLVEALAALPVREVEALLEQSRGLEELLAGLAKLVVEGDGMSEPRATARKAAPAATSRQATSAAKPRKAAARWPRAPVSLLWQREDLRPRLEYAARRGETLALELAGGVRYVEIGRVLRRGTTWMVLGDDRASDDAVALRLEDIQAIAALPDNFDFDSVREAERNDGRDDGAAPAGAAPGGSVPTRKPWQPAPGQARPAGHLPCPCGSGVRYRSCCRDIASA